jgi:predicted DNA binding CopG/RHH family protein
MKKEIPKFKSEVEEFEFWSSTGPGADSSEFLDWSQAKRAKFPNLKPTLRTISVRLPVAMIEDLKILANQRDVPYQSLLKVFLAERLTEERRGLFIEQRPEGDYAVRHPRAGRASAVEQTQAKAIERAREIAPNASKLVERVRNTNVGGRGKWRKP